MESAVTGVSIKKAKGQMNEVEDQAQSTLLIFSYLCSLVIINNSGTSVLHVSFQSCAFDEARSMLVFFCFINCKDHMCNRFIRNMHLKFL